ncbi:MAG: hypothetical protein R2813_00780 [Flavobacteriales bacterium]
MTGISIMLVALTSVRLQGQEFTESKSFQFFEASILKHDSLRVSSYSIDSGSFVVFEFATDNAGDQGNHSKAESRVSFQLVENTEQFSWNGPELKQHNAIYMQLCRCMDPQIHFLEAGTIKGHRLENGNWQVDMDVITHGRITGKEYQIKESAEFIKSNH